MRNSMRVGLLALSLAALPVAAQMMPQESKQVVSEPGKRVTTETVRASGAVTAIDKSTRTLTLEGPAGRTLDVVASSDVRNFDQIKVGDIVDVQYTQSRALKLIKPGAPHTAATTSDTTHSEPGETPAVEKGYTVTDVANVIDVDPARMTITIQIPKGKVILLKIINPAQFQVVKEGDQVEVTYTAAVALSVDLAKQK